MKKTKSLLALLMVLALCLGIFAGCGTTTSNINDDGTLELSIYEVLDSTVEITDYAAVDLENYTTSEATETYTIADGAVISVVEEGILIETTSGEIIAGDMLVIYTDDSDITNIVIYHAEEDSTT